MYRAGTALEAVWMRLGYRPGLAVPRTELDVLEVHADYACDLEEEVMGRVRRKRTRRVVQPQVDDRDRGWSGFSVGRGERKLIKAYRKDWELDLKPRKQWIREFYPPPFTQPGAGPIVRVEVRAVVDDLRRYLGEGADVEDVTALVGLVLDDVRIVSAEDERTLDPLWILSQAIKWVRPWDISPRVRTNPGESSSQAELREISSALRGLGYLLATRVRPIPSRYRDALVAAIDSLLELHPEKARKHAMGIERLALERGDYAVLSYLGSALPNLTPGPAGILPKDPSRVVDEAHAHRMYAGLTGWTPGA